MLFGKNLSKAEILKRVGDMTQIAGARSFEFNDGPARGVRAIEVYTGSGFRFTIVPDRGMDISHADHNGRSLCWHSGSSEANPGLYQPEGLEWLYNFYGGLVVTCGLTYYGAPCVDQGEALGLHGRVSNIPAREVGVFTGWDGNEYFISVRGKVMETRLFGAHLCMERVITTWAGLDSLCIHDEVTNVGHTPCPHMMLYHCNFGYPVVSDTSVLCAPSLVVTPRDETAEDGKTEYAAFHTPVKGYAEKVYYHNLAAKRGATLAGILNKDTGFGAYLRFNLNQLSRMIEWKQMGEGEYVVGLEPCTNRVEGRDIDRSLKTLRFLKPGETVTYDVEIGALPDAESLTAFEKEVRSLTQGRKPAYAVNPQPPR